MARDSDAVASLKKFYKDKLTLLDPTEVFEELTTTSDRAVVIIQSAYLDDALEYCLAKPMRRMTKAEHELAFRFDGPIGSFSARIEMCYLLKLIEDDLRSQLHDIREMRNACAHSKRPISFKTSQLMNVANRVIKGSLFKDASTIRVAFLSECSFIFNILISSKEEALKALQASLNRPGIAGGSNS